MTFFDFLQDLMPSGWFNDIRMNYGETLTDEMIVTSVQQASDFFNMENPMAVKEDWTTGVYPNATVSPIDDILIFNREQLVGMGITEQDGLDLVMTHECAHRALQGMRHLGFDSHQEELCCDFMAGVRAGLNGIDVSQMENSLVDTTVSDTHPAGGDRVDSIEAGVKFAEEYYKVHEEAPTFSQCLDYFMGKADIADLAPNDQITLKPEHSAYASESTGSIGYTNQELDGSTLKGYTKAEIDRKIAKAEKERAFYESEVRHHTHMAKNAITNANAEYHWHEVKLNQAEVEKWKNEYQKWKWTKPDEK